MDGYSRKEKLLVRVLDTQEEGEHFQQDIELLYILEGSMDVKLGEQITHMEPEDILVVNANRRHSYKASADILFAQLFIDYQLISDIFQSMNIIFWCDSTKEENERYDELRGVIKQLLNHYLSSQGGVANFGHIALCYQVMDLLSVHFLVRPADQENIDDKDKFEERILQINNYIRANYSQPISLKELSEKLYLSNGYLSRFFKKNYGMSFAEYLSNIRLYHAVDELLYTSVPITRIAYDNGFASVAVFNKAFKKAYGDTPSAFRRKSREEKVAPKERENEHVIEERLEQFLQDGGMKRDEQEDARRVQDEYSCQTVTRTRYIWNHMINIGSAAELLKSEVRTHVILLKEALGFQYVRFWNIFSKELLIDIDRGDDGYNFLKLDSILDFLVAQDIRPHIELGCKPKRIQGSVQNILLSEDSSPVFEDMAQWERVIDALMRHLVHRYGKSEIGTWRMEVWFDEGKWESGKEYQEYYDLFGCTYEIVKRYSEKIQVGGCGLRLDYMEACGREFMEGWKKQKYRPDYISIIYFAYIRGEVEQDKYAKRSTDNEGMLHRIAGARKMLREAGMEDIQLLVTEWNLSISDRNFINDTCFKGAYVMKNVLDLYDSVDEMAYFTGSDRVSEYYDSNTMLHGGTGVMTKDGVLKPSGFALEFLNRLYPYMIGKGENYLITTDRQDTYGIVCHNQKALNYNYYLTKEEEIDKAHIWKYFENRDPLELHLVMKDVEDGTYQVKTYCINEQNGSVLNIWAEMDYDGELSRNDIKYFRRACEPRLSILKCEAHNGKIQVDIRLGANEIAFIKLRRLV